MTLRAGLVGCGFISDIYLANLAKFRDVAVVACADAAPEAAARQAQRYGIEARSVAQLLADPSIDLILNLTTPEAHAEISLAIVEAGKSVYSEKPLATQLDAGRRLLEAARRQGVLVGCAPDTVLGPGYQTARAMIEAGEIGRPLSALAAVLSHGYEHWHPNPAFYYQPGGGPVFDMGPYYLSALATLLGPISEVQALGQIGFAERTVTTPHSPKLGQTIKVETLTTVQALLQFESGAQATLLASFDVWRHGLAPIELHGETATLRLPDPNFFAGDLEIAVGREPWRRIDLDHRLLGRPNWPADKAKQSNWRGLGVADLARAILDRRPPRASGDFALHVLATMEAIALAATERRPVRVEAPFTPAPTLGDAEVALWL
ncbi:MAG: Gfo/Idh/MocA family oxidoreductase [Pseudomonadota bacterium]|nr:Gfo/Idh/MocA family oxidoreductase [Pseudomonadota bacterium]